MALLQIKKVGTTGRGTRLLVLLHGYGADEHDLAPLTPYIDPDGRFYTVCPRAPLDVLGFGAGWYERDDNGSIDPAMFLASLTAVDQTIDETCAEQGFDRGESVVIGFSQGGAMALASSLRVGTGTRPRAVACLSGMLQEIDGVDYVFDDPRFDGPESDRALPSILVHHGTMDPLVTIERGRNTRDRFLERRVEHIYREYPMQHEIGPESVVDLRDWLAAV